jgi:protease-4
MALETETVLDRRRLRRRLSVWRGLAIVVGLFALGLVAFSSADGVGLAERNQIARISLEGIITEDRDQLKLLKRLAEAKHVAAVILFVNSPGGTTTGGEALFEAIRDLARTKPVVAGSVGVIFQWAEVSQLLDKVGVKMNEIKSGPLKANPSPFQPLDEAGKHIAEQMVAESQRWFVGLVATRRGIDTASVAGLEQGRVFSGREALSYKLVDQIGGEAEVVKWLEDKRNIPKGLKVQDWKPKRESDWGLLSSATSMAVRTLIGPDAAKRIFDLMREDGALGRLRLDGLISIWQASER